MINNSIPYVEITLFKKGKVILMESVEEAMENRLIRRDNFGILHHTIHIKAEQSPNKVLVYLLYYRWIFSIKKIIVRSAVMLLFSHNVYTLRILN